MFESHLASSEVPLSTQSHISEIYFKRTECTLKAAPAATKVWFWRELWSAAAVLSTEQPAHQHLPDPQFQTFQPQYRGVLDCPESNLQCFMSTLCYLWPAGAVADEQLSPTGASSCPDLLGLMVQHTETQDAADAADAAGCSRMQLCAQMSLLWSELSHQRFDWMTGSELLTELLSSTSSASEISSCRCCADNRGPLSGYFS